jgi:hypothetical protein
MGEPAALGAREGRQAQFADKMPVARRALHRPAALRKREGERFGVERQGDAGPLDDDSAALLRKARRRRRRLGEEEAVIILACAEADAGAEIVQRDPHRAKRRLQVNDPVLDDRSARRGRRRMLAPARRDGIEAAQGHAISSVGRLSEAAIALSAFR